MEREFSRTPTKWNFDEERMKALSAYITLAEESFSYFTSYEGMKPIESLYNKLCTVKRAMVGAGANSDDAKLKEKGNELEKLKRDCNDAFLKSVDHPKEYNNFVIKSIEFFNKAEGMIALIHSLNTKNGLYFRRTEDPGRAIEM